MHLSRRSRWLIFTLVLYLACCLLGGVYIADGALHPARRDLTEAQAAGFRRAAAPLAARIEDVSIRTPDGALLQGWLVHPLQAKNDTVLLLHGLGDNRLGMTGYAVMLLRHGYTVLLPDARAHGSSGGSLATYGLLERNDVRQWVDFVEAKVKPHCVYGLGESMGAAQLLESLDARAGFCAVVAESPFSDFRQIAYDRMGQPFHLGSWMGRIFLRPLVEVAFVRAHWKYGLDMQQVSPEDAVGRSRVPVLLIHGQVDSNIPVRHSIRIHTRDPRTVFWEVPAADHCGALSAAPQEFESRVVTWMGQLSGAKAQDFNLGFTRR